PPPRSPLLPYTTLFRSLEGAGDAADPQLHAAAHVRGHVAADDDIRHGEPPTRLEDAEGLPEHRILVTRQVDDAVRNDHVNRIVRDRKSTHLNSSHEWIS